LFSQSTSAVRTSNAADVLGTPVQQSISVEGRVALEAEQDREEDEEVAALDSARTHKRRRVYNLSVDSIE